MADRRVDLVLVEAAAVVPTPACDDVAAHAAGVDLGQRVHAVADLAVGVGPEIQVASLGRANAPRRRRKVLLTPCGRFGAIRINDNERPAGDTDVGRGPTGPPGSYGLLRWSRHLKRLPSYPWLFWPLRPRLLQVAVEALLDEIFGRVLAVGAQGEDVETFFQQLQRSLQHWCRRRRCLPHPGALAILKMSVLI